MKIRDMLKLLKEDGWHLITQEGSHRQFKHPAKLGRVTVAGHPSKDLHPEILDSIFKQAGLKEEQKK
jgi:predicted RNA binding protein YcfA (HicA-like mRNA interferase family)